jgi:hypothetical protein
VEEWASIEREFKSVDIIEELLNDAQRSVDIIKHNRNDISRKRISETVDYDEGNSEEAPRLGKRICVENQAEWTVMELKKVYHTCPGYSAVRTIHLIT